MPAPILEPPPERVWSVGAALTNDVLWSGYDNSGMPAQKPAVGSPVGARMSIELDALGAVRVLPGLRLTALVGVQSLALAWHDDCAQVDSGGCVDGATQRGLAGGVGLEAYHRWSDWEVHADVRVRVRLPIGDADASVSEPTLPRPSFEVSGGATLSATIGIAHPVSTAGAAVLDIGFVGSLSDVDGSAFDKERFAGIAATIGYVLW